MTHTLSDALQNIYEQYGLTEPIIIEHGQHLGYEFDRFYLSNFKHGNRLPSQNRLDSMIQMYQLIETLNDLCPGIDEADKEAIAASIGMGPEVFLPPDEAILTIIDRAWDDEKATVQDVFRQIQVIRQMSNQELADRVGLARSDQTSKLLRGQLRLTEAHVLLLCDAFGLDTIDPSLPGMLLGIHSGENAVITQAALSAASTPDLQEALKQTIKTSALAINGHTGDAVVAGIAQSLLAVVERQGAALEDILTYLQTDPSMRNLPHIGRLQEALNQVTIYPN